MQIDDATFGAGSVASVYLDCSFDGSRLRAPSPGIARFERCTFRDVKLREVIAMDLEFVDCIFTGRADKCVFNGTVRDSRRAMLGRSRNEFRGNDFAAMEFRDVSFRTGIDLSQQQLPSGPAYLYVADAQAAIAYARRVVSGWEDDQKRTAGLAILRRLERAASDGQGQMLLETKAGRDLARREVLELLGAAGGTQ